MWVRASAGRRGPWDPSSGRQPAPGSSWLRPHPFSPRTQPPLWCSWHWRGPLPLESDTGLNPCSAACQQRALGRSLREPQFPHRCSGVMALVTQTGRGDSWEELAHRTCSGYRLGPDFRAGVQGQSWTPIPALGWVCNGDLFYKVMVGGSLVWQLGCELMTSRLAGVSGSSTPPAGAPNSGTVRSRLFLSWDRAELQGVTGKPGELRSAASSEPALCWVPGHKGVHPGQLEGQRGS